MVLLKHDDLAIVFTIDGFFTCMWLEDEHHIVDYGDVIREIMGFVMKEEDHREGGWIWRIKEDQITVTGQKIEDLDD